MASHYDLKQKKKTMVFWGLGWAGGVASIFVIYLGGVEYFFPTGLGGSSKFLPTA